MLDLDMRGEDEDADLRKLLADRAGRVEPLGRVRRRHADVDDDELGLLLAHERRAARRVAGLADDLEAGPLEQAREAFAQKDVVVGDNDSSAGVGGRVDGGSTLRG